MSVVPSPLKSPAANLALSIQPPSLSAHWVQLGNLLPSEGKTAMDSCPPLFHTPARSVGRPPRVLVWHSFGRWRFTVARGVLAMVEGLAAALMAFWSWPFNVWRELSDSEPT